MYSFPNTGGRDVSITALVVDMTTVGKPVHTKHRLVVSEANTGYEIRIFQWRFYTRTLRSGFDPNQDGE